MQSTRSRILTLASIAALSFVIGGRWNLPIAAWIVPILTVRFFRTSERPWRDGALVWVATATPSVIAWSGATFMSTIHPLIEAAFLFAMVPIGLIPYAIDRAYHQRFGGALWITLVFPIAATAADFFSSGSSPIGTFGAAAYAQRDFVPTMQLAAIGGLWGITFILSWAASLANHAWEHRLQIGRPAAALACLLALTLGLGAGRALLAPEATQRAPIAGFSLPHGRISGMLDQLRSGDRAGFRESADALHAQELEQIRALARQGATIVTLQEGAGMGERDQVERLLAEAAAIARAEQIYIILPTFTVGVEPPVNEVRIINPRGAVALEHVKYGGNQFEGSRKGDGVLRTIDTPYGRLSAVICWDADFPDIIRQAGQQGVDLLFIPSNDWLGVKDIHAGMAAFRAVENGLTVVRQTGQGVTLVADSYGRTVARIDSFAAQGEGAFTATHLTNVPVGATPTLYPKIGDLIGYAAQVGALALVAGLLVGRARGRIARRSAAA